MFKYLSCNCHNFVFFSCFFLFFGWIIYQNETICGTIYHREKQKRSKILRNYDRQLDASNECDKINKIQFHAPLNFQWLTGQLWFLLLLIRFIRYCHFVSLTRVYLFILRCLITSSICTLYTHRIDFRLCKSTATLYIWLSYGNKISKNYYYVLEPRTLNAVHTHTWCGRVYQKWKR